MAMSLNLDQYIVDMIKTFIPDTGSQIIFILFLLIAIWLYKQFRGRVIENEKTNRVKTDRAIESYIELDLEIKRIIAGKNDLTALNDKLVKASTNLPTTTLFKLMEWVDEHGRDSNMDRLIELQEEIRDEIKSLKNTQIDPITYKYSGGIIEAIRVYYNSKMSHIVEPIFHTIITIMFLSICIMILSAKQIDVMSAVMAIIIFVMVVDFLISDILVKGKFIHSIINWMVLILYILSCCAVFFIRPSFSGFYMFVISLIYLSYAIKTSIKKEKS